MNFDPVLVAPREEAMKAAGHWRDRILTDYLDDCIARAPDKEAIVSFSSATGEVTRLTYRELGKRVNRMALGLKALGVEANDVVSFQLPNWWQFIALPLACMRIGAVANPLMPIFRQRELTFMLGFAESKVLVIPRRFRHFDYPAMVDDIRSELPKLEQVLVIDGEGESSFERQLIDRCWEDELDANTLFANRKPSGDDVAQLIYTSGTTGEPKGVMHTANTLISNVIPYAERMHLDGSDVILMASPMAHQTGFMYGLMMPIILGAKAVYQDIWEPGQAANLIEEEKVSFTMASTPFLQDLAEKVDREQRDVASLKTFLCAGAPIPRALVDRAIEVLGADIVSAWGMTENGAVTTTRLNDPAEKTTGTDGCPLPGIEVRTVDAEGRPVSTGEEGRLQVRGCSLFAGYLKRPQLNATDADGWFETGDVARIDAEGYIRITGRSKDIIIRGAENIPVVEIEELLYRHPAVSAVALVGYPDQRLGERACAFVTLAPAHSFTMEEMVAYLEAQRIAKQYLPERLEVMDNLPRTPSGKIQKFKLREIAQAFGNGV